MGSPLEECKILIHFFVNLTSVSTVRHTVKFKSGPEVIKLFSCSTQLSIKFFLLINVKMPTIVGILAFMGGKYRSLGLSEPAKS